VVDDEGIFGVLSLKVSVALVFALLFSFSVPRYKKISEKIHTDKILGLFTGKKTEDTFMKNILLKMRETRRKRYTSLAPICEVKL
jgi:hypothetical protein